MAKVGSSEPKDKTMISTNAKLLSTFPWAPGVEQYILPNATSKELREAMHARRDFHNVFILEPDMDDIRERQLKKLKDAYWHVHYGTKRYEKYQRLNEMGDKFDLTHAHADALFPEIESRWDQAIAIKKADSRLRDCFYSHIIDTFVVFYKKLAMYDFLKPLAESDSMFWENVVYDEVDTSRLIEFPWNPVVEQEELTFLSLGSLIYLLKSRYGIQKREWYNAREFKAYKRQYSIIVRRICELRGVPTPRQNWIDIEIEHIMGK